jgi:hypothetical protein
MIETQFQYFYGNLGKICHQHCLIMYHTQYLKSKLIIHRLLLKIDIQQIQSD